METREEMKNNKCAKHNKDREIFGMRNPKKSGAGIEKLGVPHGYVWVFFDSLGTAAVSRWRPTGDYFMAFLCFCGDLLLFYCDYQVLF